ncbi:SpoIIE family protein phosphatase [Aeromicrobium chenweiae]|uniref:Histidine kinase n=1 Tax=Aeromicrobium chenweiae TaxID=2079793 RepID=A0A2S0WHS9_9ACTN|nr:SpoIIE family protein phosphatase [Aeromicrobium chenweiae]AWB90877.1 histidine kinase [Aeromicrobium chenweiae]TGN32096.1 PAS domain-containing protein [Aeromicrobium chenweiae]
MSSDRGDFFENAPCGYAELDADGRIIAANGAFLSLVDRARDDVVGKETFASLLSAGGRIYHETHFRPALQMHGEVHEIAVDLVRPDGTKVPALVSANVRGEGRKQTTRLIAFEARDRRTYEQELLRARRAAEEAEARATTLAQTLQSTFVPPTIAPIPGLEVAGAYRPAGDGSVIGGDFYDVFQISTGEWLVALGDVCGKGVDAAVLTAFVRHSIRALAVRHVSPAAVLRDLNTALLAHGSDRFCTVVLLRLLKEDDQWLVTVSSGGHPLPLLIAQEGAVAEIGASGSLIGVLSTPQLDDGRTTVGPGDRVVLFTDGVTEARRGDEPFGLDRLMSLVATDLPSAADTTSAVLDEVLTFQDGQARDDIAIVTVRVLAPGEEPPSDAPAEPEPMGLEAKNQALLALQQAENAAGSDQDPKD